MPSFLAALLELSVVTCANNKNLLSNKNLRILGNKITIQKQQSFKYESIKFSLYYKYIYNINI